MIMLCIYIYIRLFTLMLNVCPLECQPVMHMTSHAVHVTVRTKCP